MRYKIGDKVRIKSLDWYYDNRDRIDEVACGNTNFIPDMVKYCEGIVTILSVLPTLKVYHIIEDSGMFNWTDEMIEGLVEEETKPLTYEENTCEGKKRCVVYFWDSDFADKVELDLSDRELIQEDDKWFVVKKKPKYPKSYEECLKIMNDGITMACLDKCYGYKGSLITKFQELIFYRDAYWKIAGDWKPDWCSGEQKHCIYDYMGKITRCSWCYSNAILAFPTEEMRDAFYENFKKEIEICKELL